VAVEKMRSMNSFSIPPWTVLMLKVAQPVITPIVFAPFAVFSMDPPFKPDPVCVGSRLPGAVHFIYFTLHP